jgi:hypothetical protein
MKFVFTDKRVVSWPVEVRVPVNGGRHQSQSFDMTFEILDQEEYEQIVSDNMAKPDQAILERVVTGWTVTDGKDEAMPCTPDTRHAVFEVPYVRAAAIQTYLKAALGGRAKN